MTVENLIALKEGYLGRYALDSENKGRSVFDTLVDEIIALDARLEAKGEEIDALDAKIDDLEARVEALEGA